MDRVGVHSITYTNRGVVPVHDVAASLVANERLLREAIGLLPTLVPGIKIEGSEVRFQSATTNSPLKELLAYSLVIVYQDDLSREVPEVVEKMFGIEVPDSMDTLVTVLVLVIAIYGISKIYDVVGSKRKGGAEQAAPPAITGDYNTIISVAGDLIGVRPDEVESVLDKAYKGKKKRYISRNAVEFLRPAKREDGAAIEGGGVEISPAAVREAPADIDQRQDDDEPLDEHYPQQQIVIHATDLDSNRTGWAGHLPGIWDGRLKMRLYPTIDANEIYGKREIVGDVLLVYKRDGKGELVPDIFHVMRLY